MEIITKLQLLNNKERYFRKIEQGSVFIYPTDTIYGIGCDATNEEAVKRIRKIKHRRLNPFSVAVPSKKWITKNCILNPEYRKYLQKLPGPYTLLLKLKNKDAVAKAVNPATDVLGVRIPENWFSYVVSELGFPIVSTSANITKQNHMKSLADLNKEVANSADFIVYEGPKAGKPSALINLHTKKAEIIER